MSQPYGVADLDDYFEHEKDNAQIEYICKAYVNDELVGQVSGFDSTSLEEELYKLDDAVDYHLAETVRLNWESGEYGPDGDRREED